IEGTIEFDLTQDTNVFDSVGGNGVKLGIAVSGDIADVVSWQSTDALGVNFPYVITGLLTIEATGELNVPGNTIFKVDTGGRLDVYGTLHLFSGTTFTSIKDDRVDSVDSGGDWFAWRLVRHHSVLTYECNERHYDSIRSNRPFSVCR
ncbi:MAG: hypothetical protein B1H11_05115, partial [Desulfobacteraceae bacterium 4484_190.1]